MITKFSGTHNTAKALVVMRPKPAGRYLPQGRKRVRQVPSSSLYLPSGAAPLATPFATPFVTASASKKPRTVSDTTSSRCPKACLRNGESLFIKGKALSREPLPSERKETIVSPE